MIGDTNGYGYGYGSGYGFWKQEPRSAAHDALQDARCCAHGLKWLRNLSQKKEGRADG